MNAVPKIGQNRGNAGKGRPKGSPNKTTALLKDAILKAATDAGDGDLSAYLKQQAEKNPTAFMSLLGKILPLQVTGENGAPIKVTLADFYASQTATDEADTQSGA